MTQPVAAVSSNAVTGVGTLAALFYTGFASAALLVFKPVIVGALIEDYGFTASQAGWIAGIEMAGIGIAALLAVLLGTGADRRWIVASGAMLGILGCLGPLFWQEFQPLLVLRFIAGIGSGLMASVILATLGVTRNPDRTFGLYFIANYAAAACLFPVIGYALGWLGVEGGYLFLGVLLAIALAATVRKVPRRIVPHRGESPAIAPFPLGAAALSLSVSVAYWVGNGAVWAFIERLGLRAGASATTVSGILSLGLLASIAGALVASIVHTRFGRGLPILAAIAISIAAILLAGAVQGEAAFAAGALLFCFSWSSFLAYLNGLMAAQDPAGRIVALSVSSQTIGMTAGPVIAGYLADVHGYGAIVVLGLVCHTIALLLLIPLSAGQRRVAVPRHAAAITTQGGA